MTTKYFLLSVQFWFQAVEGVSAVESPASFFSRRWLAQVVGGIGIQELGYYYTPFMLTSVATVTACPLDEVPIGNLAHVSFSQLLLGGTIFVSVGQKPPQPVTFLDDLRGVDADKVLQQQGGHLTSITSIPEPTPGHGLVLAYLQRRAERRVFHHRAGHVGALTFLGRGWHGVSGRA
ncbi:hypothetical protein F4778DRAFT_786374 [Xylariomycetidae sp. FL2044]|nr:hypothetical protein F4778DRAFT_786374 [Xylariomycetidae sp. FL2044]